MTRNAEPHRVVHSSLSHGHLREIAMTRRALNTRANVRRVVETHMRLFNKSVNALPRNLFLALRVIAQFLNARVFLIADILMTTHAHIDARNSGERPGSHAGMAVLTLDSDFVEVVNLVRKINWLFRLGFDA